MGYGCPPPFIMKITDEKFSCPFMSPWSYEKNMVRSGSNPDLDENKNRIRIQNTELKQMMIAVIHGSYWYIN